MVEQKPEISQKQIQPEVISVTPKKSPLPVILLGILGLFVVAGAVYAGITIGKKQAQPNVVAEPTITPQTTEVSPTPDETANWKTFVSEKMHFSVKYPPTWFSHKESYFEGGNSWDTNLSFPVDNESPQDFIDGQKAGINISYNPSEKITLQEHASKIVSQDSTHQGREATMSEMKIDGINAIVVDIREPQLRNRIVLFDNNGRYMFSLAIEKGELASSQSYISTFDQILSTFKFTN